MERETNKIKTPNGHEIEFYSYVTGREQRDINGALYSKSQVEIVDDRPVIKEINVKDVVEAIQEKTIEKLILNINGQTENILETVLDMRAEDYECVISALKEVTEGKKKE